MPLTPTSYYPSKYCPICRERLWFEDRLSKSTAWQYYNVHVHRNHPDFEKWNRRMSWNYFIALLLLFGSPAVGVLANVPTLILAPFEAAGLIVAGAVFVGQQKGKSRFRKLWNQEHGAPLSPQ